jgi:hypothetical protein
MASINTVNNSIKQVNATLNNEITATNNVNASVINLDNDVKSGFTTLNASVNTLDGDLKSGFAQTVNWLKIIAQIDVAAVKLLFHLTQQVDTMICSLQQISQNTCGILTQVTIQTPLQQRLVKDADALRAILASAHPEAALELHRLAELQEQIEKCCPPPQPQPACTFVACPSPIPIDMPPLPKVGGDTPPGTN